MEEHMENNLHFPLYDRAIVKITVMLGEQEPRDSISASGRYDFNSLLRLEILWAHTASHPSRVIIDIYQHSVSLRQR
jgi:hypothetical protein